MKISEGRAVVSTGNELKSGVNAPDSGARGGKGTTKQPRGEPLTRVSSTGEEFRLGNFAGIFLPNKQPVFVAAMWATALLGALFGLGSGSQSWSEQARLFPELTSVHFFSLRNFHSPRHSGT